MPQDYLSAHICVNLYRKVLKFSEPAGCVYIRTKVRSHIQEATPYSIHVSCCGLVFIRNHRPATAICLDSVPASYSRSPPVMFIDCQNGQSAE